MEDGQDFTSGKLSCEKNVGSANTEAEKQSKNLQHNIRDNELGSDLAEDDANPSEDRALSINPKQTELNAEKNANNTSKRSAVNIQKQVKNKVRNAKAKNLHQGIGDNNYIKLYVQLCRGMIKNSKGIIITF